MISKFTLAIILFLSVPLVALAQTPTPTPSNSGYTFEVYEYRATQPSLNLDNLFSTEFINITGSSVLTMMRMFDESNFMARFVLLLLAVAVVGWLYSFVTGNVLNRETRRFVNESQRPINPFKDDDEEDR